MIIYRGLLIFFFCMGVQNVFAEVCAKDTGIIIIRHLMDLCGYQKVSVVGNPATGDIQDRGTLYNEARRNLYLEIRRLIPLRYLRQIEHKAANKK